MNTYGPTLSLHAALPICGVEPDQPHRRPVRAPIIIAGAIGTARAGEAAGRVREILEPAVVLRVGAAAVGHRIEVDRPRDQIDQRSEEHTSELQSLMRISYAVLCFKKKNTRRKKTQ